MTRLHNEFLEVDFDAGRPLPLGYRHLPSGMSFGGAPGSAALSINGTVIPWSEWQVTADQSGVPLHAGYDLRHRARGYALRSAWELKGFELVLVLSVLADGRGDLETIELSGPLLVIDASEGSIWREEWAQKGWEDRPAPGLWVPTLVEKPASELAPDPGPRLVLYCCWYRADAVCATVRGSARCLPVRNQVLRSGNAGTTTYAIGLGPYQYRSRKKTLDPLTVQVAFLPDLNGDGVIDASDYQLWVNRQLPLPRPTHRDAIWYKIYCGDRTNPVTTSLAQAEEIIERVHRFTGGLPQVVYLVGWQYDGHDSGYPSLDRFNTRLGTREQLRALHARCRSELNTTLSYHVNLDDSYPGHPGWDPEVICIDPSGNLMQWEEFQGEMAYHVSHTKDVESGKVFRRLEAMMAEVPVEGALHIDAFRSTNWSWEPDGLIGSVEELECGVRPLLQWLNDRGIDVTIEAADNCAAEYTGLVSGIWHAGQPRELVQLRHGKLLYGGRTWPPTPWDHGLGCAIDGDVIFSDDVSRKLCGSPWWPLLLDGIYLGTLLYHAFLESEMLCFHADSEGARLRYADATETTVRRDGSGLLVKRGDVTIAEGFDRFIPRGDSVYAFSRDGSRRTWTLPAGMRNRTLEVKPLGGTGAPGDAGKARTVTVRDTVDLDLEPRAPVKLTPLP